MTALQNVFCIFGSTKHGINVFYNITFGFPGDVDKDDQHQAAIVPALFHLPPPRLTTWLRLSRFSPLAEERERFGDYPLIPFWRYKLHFSDRFMNESGLKLDQYVFFYDNPLEEATPSNLNDRYKQLQEIWYRWGFRFRKGASLFFRLQESGVIVFDTRYQDEPVVFSFSILHGQILSLLVDSINSFDQIVKKLNHEHMKDTVKAALDELLDHRLLLSEEHRFVTVVFPEACYSDSAFVEKLYEQMWKSISQEHHYPGSLLTVGV